MKAESLPNRSEGRMALVEQRAVTLLLKSFPEAFRQELISNRILSCSGIIYRVHQKWQPGGALEKAQLLQFLVQPPVSSSPSACLENLRTWQRMLRRGNELGTVPPDPSLLLQGLDALSKAALAPHQGVVFRVSSHRNVSGVDYSPTSENVRQLSDFILAELETLTLTEDPSTRGGPAAPKRPKVAKTAEPSGATEPPAVKALQPQGGTASTVTCKNWLSSSGCRFGKKCTFHHDTAALKGTLRCWVCSSDQHMKAECPRAALPEGQGEAGGTGGG